MYFIFLISAVVVSYLSGSANFAIIVSTLVGKEDIRDIGTKNAGTANIGRNLGKGWGAVVFIGDIAKGVIPLYIANQIYFSFGDPAGIGGLTCMAMAVILGHRRPIFFGFRGGGGLASTLGVMGFLAPAETLVSMILGYALGMTLFRSKELKLGRWTAMLILLINPVVCIGFSLWHGITLFEGVRLGGLSWYRTAAVGTLAVYIVLSNLRQIVGTFRNE